MTTATLPATPVTTGRQARTGVWTVDPGRSRVGFAVKQLGLATVRGEFREFEGTIEIDERLGFSRAYGMVRAASIDTGHGRRDEHLRSADFLDAANRPELRFESTAIEALDDRTLRIAGELELHGMTRAIELEAEVASEGERRALRVRGTLSRRDYELGPTAAFGTVNAMIADKVRLELDIAAVRRD